MECLTSHSLAISSPYESTFIGGFLNSKDEEDAQKLNDLYRLGHKYRVWSLVFDIWITFSEYVELYASGRFFRAIELAYQMNESNDWLLVYISRACKYNIKRLVEKFRFLSSAQTHPTAFW